MVSRQSLTETFLCLMSDIEILPDGTAKFSDKAILSGRRIAKDKVRTQTMSFTDIQNGDCVYIMDDRTHPTFMYDEVNKKLWPQ